MPKVTMFYTITYKADFDIDSNVDLEKEKMYNHRDYQYYKLRRDFPNVIIPIPITDENGVKVEIVKSVIPVGFILKE